MDPKRTPSTVTIVAGIGAFVLFVYWFVILVPSRPIDRILDQYGLWIVLAILLTATIVSGIAAVRVSRWWALVSLSGVAATVKFTVAVIHAYRTG